MSEEHLRASDAAMGLKDIEIYVKKKGVPGKNTYCFGADDTIKEVKEEIIRIVARK